MLGKGIEPEGKRIAVLGAGGAARAVSFILAERKASIVILNRQSGMDRAKKLASMIYEKSGNKTDVLELSRENLAEAINKSDILVNTTSVGMSPDIEKSPVPAELLKPGLTVFDIVYNPVKTRLIRDAERAGAQTISGTDMLVWQGAQAFELWTGKKPPVGLMKKEVLKFLQPGEKQ
jgi:shikimate dehydrogenase